MNKTNKRYSGISKYSHSIDGKREINDSKIKKMQEQDFKTRKSRINNNKIEQSSEIAKE